MSDEPTLPKRSLLQSLAVQSQIHLPGTIGRILKQIRDIERIAPLFLKTGLVRSINRPSPLDLRTAGIATAEKQGPIIGGLIYVAAATRFDLAIERSMVSTIGQDSTTEIDDINYEDTAKRLQLINIRQAYRMADAALRSGERYDLIVLDTPLMLNRSIVPPRDDESFMGYRFAYDDAIETIARFWNDHRDRLFPWNPDGPVVAGVASSRLGAIVHIAQQDLRSAGGREHILSSENIDTGKVAALVDSEGTISGIGERRFLKGILGSFSRTATFRMNVRTPEMEPKEVVRHGVIGFHYKSLVTMEPKLVQLIGDAPTDGRAGWSQEALDRVAGWLAELTMLGGKQAAPLPVQLAARELRALETFIDHYRAGIHQGIREKEVEQVWLSGIEEELT